MRKINEYHGIKKKYNKKLKYCMEELIHNVSLNQPSKLTNLQKQDRWLKKKDPPNHSWMKKKVISSL